ncbi:uncharacterized protein LOC131691092 [Topomyia yanbarensis]|uniref:uncharacterized protein LOC131691092 n=1 Tax=Topomyia yanbarensis TaxID=2498891 RepID=UPI00273AAEAD|nr:uncharacterized protein LOC131691092 [Topomyia yanbarensis]
MAKFITLGVALLAMATTILASGEAPTEIEAKIQLVENIADFKAANPDLELIPMETTRGPRQQILYTVGYRVSGDKLVASIQDGWTWSTMQDVTLTLTYPTSGVGAIVSYAQVVVNQSSNLGQGYVVAGGVGQRYIQIVIQAFQTTYFNYVAQVYGY